MLIKNLLIILILLITKFTFCQTNVNASIVNIDTISIENPYEISIHVGSESDAHFILTNQNYKDVKKYLDSLFDVKDTKNMNLKESIELNKGRFTNIYEALTNRFDALYSIPCSHHRFIYCLEINHKPCESDCDVRHEKVDSNEYYYTIKYKSNKIVRGIINASVFQKAFYHFMYHPCNNNKYCHIYFGVVIQD